MGSKVDKIRLCSLLRRARLRACGPRIEQHQKRTFYVDGRFRQNKLCCLHTVLLYFISTFVIILLHILFQFQFQAFVFLLSFISKLKLAAGGHGQPGFVF